MRCCARWKAPSGLTSATTGGRPGCSSACRSWTACSCGAADELGAHRPAARAGRRAARPDRQRQERGRVAAGRAAVAGDRLGRLGPGVSRDGRGHRQALLRRPRPRGPPPDRPAGSGRVVLRRALRAGRPGLDRGDPRPRTPAVAGGRNDAVREGAARGPGRAAAGRPRGARPTGKTGGRVRMASPARQAARRRPAHRATPEPGRWPAHPACPGSLRAHR